MKQPWYHTVLSIFLLLSLWEGWIFFKPTNPYIMPSPSAIMRVLWQDRVILFQHWWVTICESLLGLVIAISLAITLGAILSMMPRFRRWFYPYIVISQMVPLIAISPLLILWFGFGLLSKIFIVTLIVFFPMLQAFLDGIARIDQDLMILFDSLQASKTARFFKLLLPVAMMNILSGMKVSVTYCISAAMIGEWLGAQQGLGVYIQRSMSTFKSEGMFAGIFLVVVSTLLLLQLLFCLENRFVRQKNVFTR